MIELVKNKSSLTLEKPYLRGEPGGYYVPDVSPEGELTWTPSDKDLPAVESANIMGNSGVYCGPEEPQDQDIKVWIDPQGTVVGEYATTDYVNNSIADLHIETYAKKEDLTDLHFATKDYVAEQVAPKADKTYVDSAINGLDFATHQEVTDAIGALQLDGLASKHYVDNSINGLNINQYATTEALNAAIGSIDVSTYATKTELNQAISGIDVSTYATKKELETAIAGIDTSSYATKEDIKDFTTIGAVEAKGYQTASQVEGIVTGKGYQTSANVKATVEGYGYQNAAQVTSAITSYGYQTASQVQDAINTALGVIENGDY